MPARLSPLSEARHSAAPPPNGAGPAPSLPRRRRRGLLLAGIAITCLAVLATAALVASAGHRVPVLVATRSIPVGSVITPGDLTTAEISAGPGIASIPAGQEAQVAGRAAAVTVPAGSLLTAADVTTAVQPGPGQALVPVAVKSWQIPASGLAAGDPVLVIATPGAAGQAAGGQAAQSLRGDLPATVYQVAAPDQAGNVVVDLLVPEAQAPAVAMQASTGQIALVETSRRT